MNGFNFENIDNNKPLSELLRPKKLDDFVGQSHLIAKGCPLRLCIENKKIHSMILWGPPGVGKTTLAHLLAKASNFAFVSISAVLSGVKEIREIIYNANISKKNGINTVLFVDEVHHFNKSQQDIFLPYIEEGLFYFIGATTENPSFELNSALLSRVKIYTLKRLEYNDLKLLLFKSLYFLNSKFKKEIELELVVQDLLIKYSDGDGRRLVSSLDILFDNAISDNTNYINRDFFKSNFFKVLKYFDKYGDGFYDQISALHKSIRGSDPDAALYWLCRMLEEGVDPSYLIRRIIRISIEDIGLSDPRAIMMSVSCAEIYNRLGSPEGELALANIVVYMSCTSKSNSVYKAYTNAKKFSKENGSLDVPIHLRNSSNHFEDKFGFGSLYRYSHDEPNAFSPGQRYFPEGLDASFYSPTEFGLESKIKEKLIFLKKLNSKNKK